MGVQNGRGLISRIDKRAALLAAATIAIQCATYWLAQFIIKTAGLVLHSPETWLDARIPFLPVFLVPYVGCFAHWVITFYIVYKTKDGFAPIIHRGRDGLRHCHRNFSHLAHHDYPPRGAGDGRVGIHIRNNLRNGCSAQSVPQRALLRFVSVHDIYREKLWHTPLVRLAQRGNVRACVHGNGVREAAFYNRCCGRNGARRALLGSGGKGKTARMCRACVRSVKFA